MTIDTKALLPCPFCGGKAAIAQPIDGAYCAECSDCMASSALRYSCGDEPVPLVAEAWNSRHAADRLAALEARAKQAIDILADMHADDETCQFNGGDGCLACLAQEALAAGGDA